MGHWRDEWDCEATAESDRYDTRPLSHLLEDIEHGRYGEYHTIWYALAKRAGAHDAAWVLFRVLRSDAPYLARYHCAAALLQVLRTAAFQPVELSAERFPLEQNFAKVRALIEARVGTDHGR